METAPYSPRIEVVGMTNHGFLSATFGFFALALLMSTVGVFAGFSLAATHPMVFNNPIIFFGIIIAELVLAWTAAGWSHRLPLAYWLFTLFTFLSGFTLVPLLAMAGVVGGVGIILKALFSAVCLFAAAGLYGWTTKRSLVSMGSFLFMALVGLIVLGILGMFFPWGNTMELVFSGAGVLIFSGFIMYEVQALKSSRFPNPLLAAMSLYLSFINLFTSLLRLLMALRDR